MPFDLFLDARQPPAPKPVGKSLGGVAPSATVERGAQQRRGTGSDMLDLRSIEVFLAVCEVGNLSGAARQLGITQAAVSQRLAQLERDIGVQLIDRAARPLRLLPAGAELRARGRRLIAQAEDTRHVIERYHDVEVPELRLGILESLATALMPRLVPDLRRITGALSVTAGTTGPLFPELVAGELDIIITSERIEAIEDIETHPIIREPLVVIVPGDVMPPREPEDLQRLSRTLTFVRYGSRRRRMATLIDRQLQRLGVDLPRTLDFASSTPVVEMVRQGGAFAIVTPLCLHAAGIKPGDLTVAPLPALRFSRQIDLVAPAERLLDLPKRVAELARGVLTAEVEPLLREFAPFAGDTLIIGEVTV